MSLLCLSAADVARVTSKFSPIALQTLMAHVFFVLTHNNDTETPQSYTPPRITIPTQNHTALFMPARISQAHPAMLRGTSIKVVCIPTSPTDVRGLPASTLVLDEETGAVKAILNAGTITALRNAAGSLLSSNLIGLRTPANVVAFGAGAQIAAHLDLHLRAFPSIYTCTIVNRSVNERASKLADHLRAHFPVVQISTLAHDASAPSPNPALRDALLTANLIICATSSTVPLFPSSWVSDGTHIVLIGSYKHTMHEVDEALIRRALPSDVNAQSSLIVDSSSACLAEAGELISAGIERREVVEIGELVSFGADGGLLDAARQPPLGEMEARGTTGPVTIFKSVGVGLQDVAIACAVVQKAEELGIGQYVNWA
ncbi:NAD(P)-binding protein [Mycena capillaripes]|nr:NAD(P)-binding protein [Mycena capillaripes]